MSVWPLEKLGSVLDKSENWIEVQPDKEYSEVSRCRWSASVGDLGGGCDSGSRDRHYSRRAPGSTRPSEGRIVRSTQGTCQ